MRGRRAAGAPSPDRFGRSVLPVPVPITHKWFGDTGGKRRSGPQVIAAERLMDYELRPSTNARHPLH